MYICTYRISVLFTYMHMYTYTNITVNHKCNLHFIQGWNVNSFSVF